MKAHRAAGARASPAGVWGRRPASPAPGWPRGGGRGDRTLQRPLSNLLCRHPTAQLGRNCARLTFAALGRVPVPCSGPGPCGVDPLRPRPYCVPGPSGVDPGSTAGATLPRGRTPRAASRLARPAASSGRSAASPEPAARGVQHRPARRPRPGRAPPIHLAAVARRPLAPGLGSRGQADPGAATRSPGRCPLGENYRGHTGRRPRPAHRVHQRDRHTGALTLTHSCSHIVGWRHRAPSHNQSNPRGERQGRGLHVGSPLGVCRHSPATSRACGAGPAMPGGSGLPGSPW